MPALQSLSIQAAHNKSLQPTAQLLRSRSAAELRRYAHSTSVTSMQGHPIGVDRD